MDSEVANLAVEIEQLMNKGRYMDAMSIVDKNLDSETSPSKYLDYLKIKSDILVEQRKNHEALEIYDKILNLKPDDHPIWGKKAMLLAHMKKFEDAHICVDKALSLKPEESKHWDYKATIFMVQEQYDKALTAIDEAIELDPEKGEYLALKGHILAALDKIYEADYYLNRAIELDPDNPLIDDLSRTLNILKEHSGIKLNKNKESKGGVENKGSIISAILWMAVLSILLGWIPILGSLIAGYVGGKKAGSVSNALIAVALPALLLAILIYTVFSSIPIVGALIAGAAFTVVIVYNLILVFGAVIGGASAGA